MDDLAFAPAHAIADAVRRREIGPTDVLDHTFARLRALDPVLNAFVAVREEEARAEAAELERRLARGEDVGPLAGVPFAVKDEEAIGGLPTTYGSVPFRQHVAERDSTQVARLRRAGAIPVGKTNLPEFGSTAFTKNHLYGVTRNPWNLERTPGGSSGGSAAAVAAGIVPAATGGDGGGSIRIPASYSGLVGFKGTYGRISRGPLEFRHWLDTVCRGPLVRSVSDAALWVDAVVGLDPRDPDSLPHPGFRYADVLERLPRGLRVGYHPTLGYARVDPAVRKVVEASVVVLGRALGVEVEPLHQPLTDVGIGWALLNAFETYGRLAPLIDRHRDDWGRGFIEGVRHGARVGPPEVARFQADRLRLVHELADLFDRVDVLLTPTVPTVAFAAKGPMPDVIDGEKLASPIHAVAFTYPFNMSGHPAISMPAGLVEGLPVGLQIVAQRGHDELALQVARAFEQAQPFSGWPREPRQQPGTAA
jgi:aspartyl-tRNA(Asn)/glutamyl-tRNA(Gln) amidotransferase subunit A